ncbi:MAG: hypothetical protein ACPKM1_13415 [Spirochaetaceae bacterium]
MKFGLLAINSLFVYMSCSFLFEGSSNSSVVVDYQGIQTILESEYLGCIDSESESYDADAVYSNNSCEYGDVTSDEVDYIVENGVYLVDNDDLGLEPGAIIGIRAGDRGALLIRNFEGTEENPFTFINCDGQVVMEANETADLLHVNSSKYLRITGTGSSSHTYGIKLNGSKVSGFRGQLQTDHIEIDHLEVTNTSIGIWVVTKPTCDGSSNRDTYTQEETYIHHNYVHDVENEGFYIGGSKWEVGFTNDDCSGETLWQPNMVNVEIYNNITDGTGWDGIQLGGAIEGGSIHHNTVLDYGIEEKSSQQAGIMINPGTTASVYSNYINRGTGIALHVTGFDNLIYSNVIENIESNGIQLGDRSPYENKSYRVVNNTFISIEGKAFNSNSSESVDNVFYNNLMIDVGDDISYSSDNTTVSNNMTVSSLENLSLLDEYVGYYLPRDYTPASDSPLIDAGLSYEGDELLIDIYSRPRLMGNGLDIGAFEYQNN